MEQGQRLFLVDYLASRISIFEKRLKLNIRKRIEKLEKLLNEPDAQLIMENFCFADYMELYNYLEQGEDYHQIVKKSNIINSLNRQKPGAGNKLLNNWLDYYSKEYR